MAEVTIKQGGKLVIGRSSVINQTGAAVPPVIGVLGAVIVEDPASIRLVRRLSNADIDTQVIATTEAFTVNINPTTGVDAITAIMAEQVFNVESLGQVEFGQRFVELFPVRWLAVPFDDVLHEGHTTSFVCMAD